MTDPVAALDRQRLTALLRAEEELFARRHPRSRALFERAKKHLLDGVPMNWMTRWAGPYPVFVAEASGPYFTDVDGIRYLDFCLGDTGAMTGHSPEASVSAIIEQLRRGITLMLPTEDAVLVAEELSTRFGLPYWQVAITATDANRFVVRLARHITRRPKILVYDWCYHGTVDETFITVTDGVPGARPGNIGPPVDPSLTTKVIQFNDIAALEEALAPGDVACVLAEPAMTNIPTSSSSANPSAAASPAPCTASPRRWRTASTSAGTTRMPTWAASAAHWPAAPWPSRPCAPHFATC